MKALPAGLLAASILAAGGNAFANDPVTSGTFGNVDAPSQQFGQPTSLPDQSPNGEPSTVSLVATIQAAPNGSGTTCSLAQPCSLGDAQAKVRSLRAQGVAGITVLLADGTYPLGGKTWRFRPEDSGSPGHPVVWKAADGARPIISGATRITGWKLHDAAKGIWSARVPANSASRQLYVEGKIAPIAQATLGELKFEGRWLGNEMGYAIGSDPAASAWFGALTPAQAKKIEFNYVGGNGSWTNTRCRVEATSGTGITMTQPCWQNTTARIQIAPYVYVQTGYLPPMSKQTMPARIENAYSLLSPGEWFLDDTADTLYYIPAPGQDMAKLDVQLPQLEHLLTVAGTLANPIHDIAFQGLQFSYATWNGPSLPSGFSEIQSNLHMTVIGQGYCFYSVQLGIGDLSNTCPIMAFSQPKGNVSVSAAVRISLTGNRFVGLGGAGLNIAYGSVDTQVQGNVFTEIASTAMLIGCSFDPKPDGDPDIGTPAQANGTPVPRPTSTQRAEAIKKNCTPNREEVVGDSIGRNEILTGTKISNNLVHDIGIDYWGASGITLLFSQQTSILNNHIYNVPYSGITAGVVQGHFDNSNHPQFTTNINAANEISYNLIHNYMKRLQDGGAIYVEGHQAEYILDAGKVDRERTLANGLLVRGNVTHTNSSNFAYYNDAGSEWINWDRNVSFNALVKDSAGNGGCQPSGHFWLSGNYLSKPSRVDFNFVCGTEPVDRNVAADNKTIPNTPGVADIPRAMLAGAGLTEAFRTIEAGEPAIATYVAPVTAGQKILIAGSGFKADTKVTFGGRSATVQYLSPGFLLATAPSSGPLSPVWVGDRLAPQGSLSAGATASATSIWSNDYRPEMAIDSDPTSRWASNETNPTLTQTFAWATTVKEIHLTEFAVEFNQFLNTYAEGKQFVYRTGAFTVEAQVNGSWRQVASGNGIGAYLVIKLPAPVTATALRINLTSIDGKPPSLFSFLAF
ncbi:IPT/TIG domain-containing protein [Labrys sp. 22185]|uniref:IPT/TIG domain-containing protein n=1 Tax=Labrys sp. 22185 TaxID=3453888 RepID=UPI003F85BD0F